VELRRGEKVAAVPCSWQEGQSPWIPPWLSNNPPSAACDGGGCGGGGGGDGSDGGDGSVGDGGGGGGGGGSSGALVGEGGPPLSPLSSAESISAAALGSARPLTSAPPRTAAHPERAATDVPLTLPSPQLLQSWGSASRGHTRRQFSQRVPVQPTGHVNTAFPRRRPPARRRPRRPRRPRLQRLQRPQRLQRRPRQPRLQRRQRQQRPGPAGAQPDASGGRGNLAGNLAGNPAGVPRRQLALASLLPIGALAAVPAPRLTHLLTAPLPPVAAHVRTRLGKKQKTSDMSGHVLWCVCPSCVWCMGTALRVRYKIENTKPSMHKARGTVSDTLRRQNATGPTRPHSPTRDALDTDSGHAPPAVRASKAALSHTRLGLTQVYTAAQATRPADVQRQRSKRSLRSWVQPPLPPLPPHVPDHARCHSSPRAWQPPVQISQGVGRLNI
jgi:hypothetical protein